MYKRNNDIAAAAGKNRAIIFSVLLLASGLQIAPVQRHRDDVLIERRNYAARFAVRRLDDVQRPDRQRFRVVRGQVHLLDVDELRRTVVVRVKRAFHQPSVVCEQHARASDEYCFCFFFLFFQFKDTGRHETDRPLTGSQEQDVVVLSLQTGYLIVHRDAGQPGLQRDARENRF